VARMEAIIATRYAPLVLPHPLNSLPADGYLKQFPKFTGEGDITVEEHLEPFYSFIDHHVIMHADVWMGIFVHSLEGEARKWFRALPLGSIDGIEALNSVFLRQWGDKKDFMYYITEFGSLKRKEGEYVSDFSKRFNNMYNNIPTEINPTEASAKITHVSSFELDFCLLLRERRATSLDHMQDVDIEVEYNIFAIDRIRNKIDRDIPKQIHEASTSCSSSLPPQMDEVTKILKSLSARMERLELEGKHVHKNPQNIDNRGNFKRPNKNVPQIMPREQRNRDRDVHRIQTPLQNNLVHEEEREEEELDPEIHYIGDTSPFPHLNQSSYEEFLMNSQINKLSRGEKDNNSSPNKYNLGSKKKEGKSDTPDRPLIA